ncbi:thiopeptide-type bacteriocin biosynthesis domain-containing protein [Chitinophaga sp. YR627]|uniref:lantibiotic dehydratase n=1 Tax=Chitinophaga sp. YR627 TaxID=1881041 RepID=UPI0008E44BC8|nr:lantibiotic dehydratase [Chitinophaga sp. YR627]SFO73298.1 thiopeptide-type bacteriocin biosynthesis domain-containing protein [Chitinophaga sp. YR627]
MSTPYSFDNRLVLRTPRFPLMQIPTNDQLPALLHDNAFLEAIYLASPVLYSECIKWREGGITSKKDIDKLTRSLTKYVIRMSRRCTPFGLFSGCAVTEWSENPTAVTVSSTTFNRHTRLDMHYLCALSQQLANMPGVKEHLLYMPNSSVYTIGDELRYVEYLYVGGARLHQISAVSASEYLDKVVSAAYNGATIGQLCNWLADDHIAEEDARIFIDELIEAQLLISEIEPAITGKEFLQQVIEVLERIELQDPAVVKDLLTVLGKVATLLQQLDASATNSIERYREIMQLLDILGVAYDESKLFQTDVVKHVSGNGINITVQDQLQNALNVMNKLSEYRTNPHLETFMQRFHERYEEQEMPLLEVLDGETGIGYVDSSSTNIAPLLDDISLPGKMNEVRFSWGALEQLLSGKLVDMYAEGRQSIEINDEDLKDFTANWNDLPPSFSVMFRIVDEKDNSIYLESAGGSSAANLLGRFAYADNEINKLVCDITEKEQAMDPEVVYAEIIHLPESRTGNILLHPVFRGYEIPYLAKSSLDKEQQIDLQDLYISVRNNRVVMRSRRLGKQIIPRLSTAHNYTNNSLPVYRFLCDLQLQDKRGDMSFHWGALESKYRFFPRVTCRNTILHLARWTFSQKDIAQLLNLNGEELTVALQQFRERWKLPEIMVLADGDNELMVDFSCHSMVNAWLSTIKGRQTFELRESLNNQQCITDENGQPYVNQLVATLGKDTASYTHLKAAVPQQMISEPAQRDFTPGSDWLYYKLYCGVKSADKILLNALRPLGAELVDAGLTDKWFFVRFNDPDFHLRVRFHLTDVSKIGEVTAKIHASLQPFTAAGYIWKVQLDTYSREITRYGANAIEQAETLFYHDSVAFTDLLHNTWGDQREEIRWLWSLRAVDELLDCFMFSLHEKHALLSGLRDDFRAEFNWSKEMKQQLDNKYRNNRQTIASFMERNASQSDSLQPLMKILREKSLNIAGVAHEILMLESAGKLEISIRDLLRSYIHMMINRTTITYSRKQEMVMYDFLARYYQSALARTKSIVWEE